MCRLPLEGKLSAKPTDEVLDRPDQPDQPDDQPTPASLRMMTEGNTEN
ncbi:hypothetical protein JS532_06695 [Bifidobacterium callimiconis]|nr:hypothetical protein [Bifidobacterium callimiconis]MBT1177252.1 hypothetical protein [Bifidobacterium callimiconis]